MRVRRRTMSLQRVFCIVLVTFTCVFAKSTYKLCVPKQYLKDCQDMLEVETKSKAVLECIPARDRMECLSFVQQRQADLVPVDPEDMYIASKMPNQDFVLIQEYRTDEEPDAEFRYEAVMVVHKDLPINRLEQLKGLKSCHTGVGRNVGYKIPLTMLKKLEVFPGMNNLKISPRENELVALSTFFNQSCIVGKWSPDPKINTQWKSKYNQLCALCEDPAKCDYPDKYSGYEGALRCLAHNGGQVAFTKVIFVRKFFGLPVGTTPASQSSENPDEFVYLCADGSKRPVRDKACSWAARPWQGLLAHNDILAKLTPLREKIKQLAVSGKSTQPIWFTKVLGLSDKIHHVADNIPIKPDKYLNKANYTEVIERGHGPQGRVVRLCVTSSVALAKCRMMSDFAYSRDLRPRLDCVQTSSEDDCLKSIRENGSDLASVDDWEVAAVDTFRYSLRALFQEVYGKRKTAIYAVAVVKKSSSYKSISDLKGSRSCHDPYGTISGMFAISYYINKNSQACIPVMADFFSGSCLPGVDKPENNPKGYNVSNLLKQCSSDGDNTPLKCLQEDRADVAFVSSLDLENYDKTQYELLCGNRNGTRDSLDNYETCNLAMIHSRTWLTNQNMHLDDTLAHMLLSLDEFLKDKTDLFNMYGEFLKNNNVIFNNKATGLAPVDAVNFEMLKFIYDVKAHCN